jgi:50S ribosomal protein L16 3-hydroxylase
LPVKILRTFRPSHDAVLAPGDFLYLPPHHAHDGVALDACTTYSIGFRAPAHQELVEAFLDRLRDTLVIPGRYTDRGLKAATRPARIDPSAMRRLAVPLHRIRWTARDVEHFIGQFLTEPKSHIAFEPPARPLSTSAFRARAKRAGVRLDLRTQLLYDARSLYVNGERIAASPAVRRDLALLADERFLTPARLRTASAPTMDLLHDWYAHGYLEHDAG